MRQSLLLSLRQLISLPIRFARGILIIPLLSPEIYYTVKLIVQWMGYLPRTMLGANSIYSYDFPRYSNEAIKGENLLHHAIRHTIISIGIALIISVFFWLYLYEGDWRYSVLILWALLVPCQAFVVSDFVAREEYNLWVRVDVFSQILAFVSIYILTYFYEDIGFYIGTGLSLSVYGFIFYKRYGHLIQNLSFTINFRLIRRGGNFLINGTISDFARTLDLTILGFVISDSILKGNYAIAFTISGLMYSLIANIGLVAQRNYVDSKNELKILDLWKFYILECGLIIGSVPLFNFILNRIFVEYNNVYDILSYLLLSVAVFRHRFYMGVFLKMKNEFLYYHLSHIIQIFALGVLMFSLQNAVVAVWIANVIASLFLSILYVREIMYNSIILAVLLIFQLIFFI